jgi:hypothetical protein
VSYPSLLARMNSCAAAACAAACTSALRALSRPMRMFS